MGGPTDTLDASPGLIPGEGVAEPILEVRGVAKTYASGVKALEPVDLEIRRGEIFALLGPNGAGKTTLIGIICGLVRATAGTVVVAGHDHARDWRAARGLIGLAPQELTTESFESVIATVRFSRGLFGAPPDEAFLERLLRDLSLWDKRATPIMQLSGGMKRRVMIAKALAHEPRILFLDEPTAGVDVELRRDMWALVRRLRESGVTIILTTHYIDEAEEMADRVGVISQGRLIVVDEKRALMEKLGRRRLVLHLKAPLAQIPADLADAGLALSEDGEQLIYEFDAKAADTGIATLMRRLDRAGVDYLDIQTSQSSLEEIFVGLVEGTR